MKKHIVRFIGSGLLLLAASVPAQAGGWFLGGGLVGVSFQEDLDDVDNGLGITFSGGYQFDDLLSAEILAGFSAHDADDYDDDAAQFSVLAGIRFSLSGEKVRPYGVVGISLNVVEFGDFDDLDDDDDFDDFEEIDGVGLYAGFGADILITQSHVLNIGFRSNRWDGTGDGRDVDVRTDMLTIAYNYYL